MTHARPYFFVLLFAAMLLASAEGLGLRDAGNVAALRDVLTAHRVLGFGAYVLLFALGNLAQIPGWLFLAAAVWAFGALWGGVITYVAAVLSCLLACGVVQRIGGSALREIRHPLARRLFAGLDAHPLRGIVLLRLIFQTAPALNYTLGLAGVRWRDNLLGTLLGLPIPIALYCVFFDALERLAGLAPLPTQ